MRIRTVLAAAIVAVVSAGLVFAGIGAAGTHNKAKKTVKLTATLKGENENPPADPNGSGKAKVKLKAKQERVCFKIRFSGIGDAIQAHIHKGGKNVNGDVRVPLFEDLQGASSPQKDCVKAKRGLIRKIAKRPSGWYVNVHTDAFPAGAIRGQLSERGGKGARGGGGGGSGGGGGAGGSGGGDGGGTGGGNPPSPPVYPY